jgi:hypothetical protein
MLIRPANSAPLSLGLQSQPGSALLFGRYAEIGDDGLRGRQFRPVPGYVAKAKRSLVFLRMCDSCQRLDSVAQPIASLVRVCDDQGGLTGTRVEPDASAVTNFENIGALEIRHVGRNQQVSLAGDGHLQHMPVFLVAKRVYAAADKRVRLITSRPERGHAADGADQGFGRARLDPELSHQNE